jgi:hypothetical protein
MHLLLSELGVFCPLPVSPARRPAADTGVQRQAFRVEDPLAPATASERGELMETGAVSSFGAPIHTVAICSDEYAEMARNRHWRSNGYSYPWLVYPPWTVDTSSDCFYRGFFPLLALPVERLGAMHTAGNPEPRTSLGCSSRMPSGLLFRWSDCQFDPQPAQGDGILRPMAMIAHSTPRTRCSMRHSTGGPVRQERRMG